MRIELLLIGDELLTGKLDPYPSEMIRVMREKGASVSHLAIATDDVESIVEELAGSEKRRTTLLVVTGGLGPTLDDVTRKAVASYLGVELVLNDEAAGWLKTSLERMHGKRTPLTPEALQMAKVPEGAKALSNPVGAAAGIEAIKGNMRIVCLPGFPREMMAMFRLHVLPTIEADGLVEREARVKLRETLLEPLFQRVVKEHPVRIASLPKEDWRENGNVVLIRGKPEDTDKAMDLFLRLVEAAKDRRSE
ncbi:MAG TPA: molybdopterin-binding protein [Methanomassiliicoccales archaeon]|nr:molybdopterin-binding protein [Methanomassiliicoccales archaeon]